jgi:hypothetical protein
MKKPSNKVIAVYLAWELLHLALLFSPKHRKALTWGGKIFYPFTKGKQFGYYSWDIYETNWDAKAYDLTEFLFYGIAPILIYYIITLFNSKDQTPQ